MGPSPLRASRIVLCLVPETHREQKLRSEGKVLQAYEASNTHIPNYNMGSIKCVCVWGGGSGSKSLGILLPKEAKGGSGES